MLSGCPGGARGRRIEPMIDGFRFPRFDREDFMNVGPGGRIQLGMLAASPVTVNRRRPLEAKGLRP